MLISFQKTSFTLLCLPLAVGFASIRWRTVSLVAVIDRFSVYVVLALLLLGCYAALSLIATTLEGVSISSLTALLSISLAIIAATTFAPMRAWIQRFVDTVFFRDYYELGPTLQRFSRSLATVRDRAEVADTLLNDLCETLNLSGAALLLLPGGLDPGVLRLVEPEDLHARRAYAAPDTLRTIVQHLAVLDVATLQRSERFPLLLNPCPGCAALVPIRTGHDGEISALLLVGTKRGGGPLRSEDRVLLATVAHQAATALENALLVGGLHTTLAQLRRSTDQLESARAEQRLLLREIVNTDERQRAALARELHDDAMQDLLYVSRHSRYCAAKIATLIESDPANIAASRRLCDELEQLAEAAATSERKLRDLCAGLYPALLESLGLPAAIETLGEDLAIGSDGCISVTCTPAAERLAQRLNADSQLHVYRIAQEGMRNASRHAQAHGIEVCLAEGNTACASGRHPRGHAPSQLLLTVVDDGAGIALPIDYAGLLRDGHLGLASMRERARRIGSELTIKRNATGGTTITIVIPIFDLTAPPRQPVAGSEVAAGSTQRTDLPAPREDDHATARQVAGTDPPGESSARRTLRART
jgi:signal transduction histidine kinase